MTGWCRWTGPGCGPCRPPSRDWSDLRSVSRPLHGSAGWADGLVTIAQPHDKLRRMIDAYRTAGGQGPVACQVHLSYATTDDQARSIAHEQWRSNVFPPPICWDLETPGGVRHHRREGPPGGHGRLRADLRRPRLAR